MQNAVCGKSRDSIRFLLIYILFGGLESGVYPSVTYLYCVYSYGDYISSNGTHRIVRSMFQIKLPDLVIYCDTPSCFTVR